MAILSGTTMNWLRPVIGFAAQPASAAKIARSAKDLNWVRIALRILRRDAPNGCNRVFRAAPPDDFRRRFTYPYRTMGKAPKEESSFRNPPLWIHVSQAGKWLLSPREARKRAVLRLLDTMKTGPTPRPKKV
jgi:hypothetical protein